MSELGPVPLDSMLERQTRERADLVERLDSSRLQRALAIVQASNQQAPVPHPSWAPVTNTSPEFKRRMAIHNLKLKDQAEVERLDTRHMQERSDRKAFNELSQGRTPKPAFNRSAATRTNGHEP